MAERDEKPTPTHNQTPFDIEILEQYLPWSAHICPNENDEGQALYTLTNMLDSGVRPAVILMLARFARDTKSFNGMAQELEAAIRYPSEAERFAARAMDHGENANAMDVIFNTVMFAAAEAVVPPSEWQHVHDVTKRIIKKMGGDEQ